MRGGRVEVVVDLLDVLAVVAFETREPKEPLLEDGIVAVPKSEGEAEPGLGVTKAENAVLTPAVGSGAGLIVREVVPSCARVRVILANGAPLPLGKVGSPQIPSHVIFAPSGEPIALGIENNLGRLPGRGFHRLRAA